MNDGPIPDRFTLADSGVVSGLGNTAKQMLVDGVDVTRQVDTGTYRSPQLEPGASLKVTVRLQAPERIGTETSLSVRATSTARPTAYDEVTAVVTSTRVAPGILAVTGSDPSRPLVVGLMVLLGGVALLAGSRRRGRSLTAPVGYDAIGELRSALHRY